MILATTGHRPPRIGGYNPVVQQRLTTLAATTLSLLRPNRVKLGMAQGFDQAAAQACVDLEIPFEAFIVQGQCDLWPAAAVELYDRLLERAAAHVLFAHREYLKRDRLMIESADTLLALYDGGTGGTEYTIRKWREANPGREPINLWGAWTT